MKILVLDIGGTHVKAWETGHKERVEFDSGPKMTPSKMVSKLKAATFGWKYEAVSIGFPGPVIRDRPALEPRYLGSGWVGFDYQKAFGRPVKIVNDAAMQALGSYQGGRMLFLGLGTGMGSALIVDHVLEPMELGHLPYKNGRSYEETVGLAGLKRQGVKTWRRKVLEIARLLKDAMQTDYVVIGGGDARLLKNLFPGARRGDNANAFLGGCRLWTEFYRASTRTLHGKKHPLLINDESMQAG
jgi:predicted NBD/HSP70 family sugar kinase